MGGRQPKAGDKAEKPFNPAYSMLLLNPRRLPPDQAASAISGTCLGFLVFPARDGGLHRPHT